jgi:isoquinoline 1-oxidoreductase beta subunit
VAVSEPRPISRRHFLVVSGGAAGGLLLGFTLPCVGRLGEARADEVGAAGAPAPQINAWLRIAPDESVTILVAESEMGQGVFTAMPMLVAEELEVDWAQVRAEMAPAAEVYANPISGRQSTGGSTSVRQGFGPLREVGAAAREMLRRAAAQRWGVALETCRAEKGRVLHPETGRALSYGVLAAQAAQLAPPAEVALKPASDWSILGRATPRLDARDKATGRAVFGTDVRLPGMLFATPLACPVFGGRLERVDPAPALRVPGVKAVVPLDDVVMVVADGYWNARKGLRALEPVWDEGPHAGVDSAAIRERMRASLDGDAVKAHAQGDTAAAFAAAAGQHEAVFEVPFLAHAAMEPMNATAHVRDGEAEVWLPTQTPGSTQRVVAEVLGLPRERVRVHTTFLGGGFGRRLETDFARQAALASQAVGAPVHVLWSREEDMRHDFYRPASSVRMRAALDAHGVPTALHARVACPSILARIRSDWNPEDVDGTAVDGLGESLYAIPHCLVEYAPVETPVPVGFWRSVGNSQNAFVREAFLDELARAAGADPLAFRLALLGDQPRHVAVLQEVARMASWSSPPPPGRYRGLALHDAYDSIVAQVAEISLESRGARVHEVHCAADCGTLINPETVEAQMQGGVSFGLAAALYGEITLRSGRVEQGNYSDYRLPTLASSPAIRVRLIESAASPGGVGEAAVPPIAPAVANAVFAATGTPVRRLPIRI